MLDQARVRPHVVPVWYVYDDEVIEILTNGRRLENVRQNPRVAISIQYDTEGNSEWTATFLGTATVVEDVDQINAAARRIYPQYLGSDQEKWDSFYRDHLGDNPPNDLLRIEIGTVSYEIF
ncbi:pyridoxamine 5'-phosphate oxidase family protein (plasmid) [Haladaptatus sp. SPP-AMP-3]|uniref:pyridoxamine 5'-phosphate oxidase family protein n=1 Tax=Haladaptatus sp. SPP-AMP-3 TaxID=3121295 RepID=UPI003C2F78AE